MDRWRSRHSVYRFRLYPAPPTSANVASRLTSRLTTRPYVESDGGLAKLSRGCAARRKRRPLRHGKIVRPDECPLPRLWMAAPTGRGFFIGMSKFCTCDDFAANLATF